MNFSTEELKIINQLVSKEIKNICNEVNCPSCNYGANFNCLLHSITNKINFEMYKDRIQ